MYAVEAWKSEPVGIGRHARSRAAWTGDHRHHRPRRPGAPGPAGPPPRHRTARSTLARADGPQDLRGRLRRRYDDARLHRPRRRRAARGRRRQLLHRPRLGHRRHQRRRLRPRRRRGRAGAGRGASRTPASWSRPTRATSPSPSSSTALTPGDHEKRTVLFNSGAEAVENAVKVARHATGRDAVVVLRPRLPRPHQPHHGADRQGHAVQDTASARSRTEVYRAAHVLPVPRREPGHHRRRGCQPAPSTMIEKQIGADQPRRRSSSSRSRARAASSSRPTASCPRWPRGAKRERRRLHRRRGPDRLRPHRRHGSPCDHEGVVPDLIVTWPRASPAACRCRPSPAAPSCMDAVHAGGLGGTYGGNPVACAAALAVHRDHARARRPGRARARDIEASCSSRRLHATAAGARTTAIGDVRGRGAMIAIELVEAGHQRARRRH